MRAWAFVAALLGACLACWAVLIFVTARLIDLYGVPATAIMIASMIVVAVASLPERSA